MSGLMSKGGLQQRLKGLILPVILVCYTFLIVADAGVSVAGNVRHGDRDALTSGDRAYRYDRISEGDDAYLDVAARWRHEKTGFVVERTGSGSAFSEHPIMESTDSGVVPTVYSQRMETLLAERTDEGEAVPDLKKIEADLGLSARDRVQIQRGLASLGFNPGPADGLFGKKTRAAISLWQNANGMPVTGYLTRAGAEALRLASARTASVLGPEVVQEVNNLLDQALTVAPGIANDWERNLALANIARARAGVGDISRALATAFGITKDYRRDDALSYIVQVQAEAGDIRGALATSRRLGLLHHHLRIRDIAEAQVKAGDVPGALLTARGIDDDIMRARELSEVAVEQAKAGDVSGAQALANGITLRSWRALTVARIAEAQAETGDLDGAKRSASNAQVLESVITDNEPTRGITLDQMRSLVLFHIATVQAYDGDLSAVLATARGITDEGMRILTLVLAAKKWSADYPEGAQRIISELRARARGTTDHKNKLAMLRVVALAQAEIGDFKGAKRSVSEVQALAHGITGEEDRYTHLSRIVEILVKIGDLEGARRLIPEALATAYGITDESSRNWKLREIAAAQAKAGDVPGALATARSITEEFDRFQALEELAAAQAKAGDVPGALTLVHGLPGDHPKFGNFLRMQALEKIAIAQVDTGNVSGALATARSISSEGTRSVALHYIARTQTNDGDVSGALATARDIPGDELRARALAKIAAAQAESGDSDGAQQTLSGALAMVISIEDTFKRARALFYIVNHIRGNEIY